MSSDWISKPSCLSCCSAALMGVFAMPGSPSFLLRALCRSVVQLPMYFHRPAPTFVTPLTFLPVLLNHT
jgi:hypothetical protein